MRIHVIFFTWAVVSAAGCDRESRRFAEPASAAGLVTAAPISPLHPGAPPPPRGPKNPYEHNAWAISEGQKLFQAFNCSGCHANGGGGMGPPLMDGKWIYGSEPANIFSTIVEGRPNGMPAFSGRIPEPQLWLLVSYVRALGGLERMDALPSRSDSIAGTPTLSLKGKEPQRPAPAEQP